MNTNLKDRGNKKQEHQKLLQVFFINITRDQITAHPKTVHRKTAHKKVLTIISTHTDTAYSKISIHKNFKHRKLHSMTSAHTHINIYGHKYCLPH